ncbi:hypothetical protein ARMGADRAFT_1037169 [Armillaria gallica]|uniref:Uncharacterized protein n=1 Tax=Armillaria gallica TaxID=47427 RepID=A0A2H3CRG0_ARMGA|nr:hypothetical protein ARMGADRAFT_1037169 [Armillaria gallica]
MPLNTEFAPYLYSTYYFKHPQLCPLSVPLSVANLVEGFRNILHRDSGQGHGNLYRAAQGLHTALTVFNSTLSNENGENTADVKELGENITNIVVFIQSLIGTHGKRGTAHFRYIGTEMEGYLTSIVRDLKDLQGKQRGLRGFLNVNRFQDTIQDYKKRVDDFR